MVAKLIAHAPTREQCIDQLAAAVDRTVLLGVQSNRAFLGRLLRHESFRAGHDVSTAFIERHFDAAATRQPQPDAKLWALAAWISVAGAPEAECTPTAWRNWSTSRPLPQPWRLRWHAPAAFADAIRDLHGRVYLTPCSAQVEYAAVQLQLQAVPVTAGMHAKAIIDGEHVDYRYAWSGSTLWLHTPQGDHAFDCRRREPARSSESDGASAMEVRAAINGRVVDVAAATGMTVAKGDRLVVLEAMKMEHEIRAAPAKVVVTCALTGVLTDPAQHNVPVTPEEMAREARSAYDAGASIVHVHFRQQAAGKGHLPSWEPAVAVEIAQAIRAACPGIIFNQSTGVVGPDISGPVACIRAVRPEIAAANAGSLNYLKVRSDGRWAWPPMIFDNPVEKVAAFLQVMQETDALPEFECFDVGIVRSVEMFMRSGLYRGHPDVNFVMGVESGMPADPALLPILIGLLPANATWQVTAIGRENVWPLHRRTAELGGNLRTGLEDTFYLPDGRKARSNGELIDAIVGLARAAGRECATPAEARQMLHLAA
jgi:uncharacterized protein (DUF849 family)